MTYVYTTPRMREEIVLPDDTAREKAELMEKLGAEVVKGAFASLPYRVDLRELQ